MFIVVLNLHLHILGDVSRKDAFLLVSICYMLIIYSLLQLFTGSLL